MINWDILLTLFFCGFFSGHNHVWMFIWQYNYYNITICNGMNNSHQAPRCKGSSWSWLHGSWIYNYLCNQCLSPLKLRVRTPLRRGILNTTLCDQVCQWLATGRQFSLGKLVSCTNKTDHHDITEILLKVALYIITLTQSAKRQISDTSKNVVVLNII